MRHQTLLASAPVSGAESFDDAAPMSERVQDTVFPSAYSDRRLTQGGRNSLAVLNFQMTGAGLSAPSSETRS